MRIALFTLLAAAAFAQPAFEVASVRMEPEGAFPRAPSLTPRRTGGQLTWSPTLNMLVRYAYDLPNWRLTGVKAESQFYTIGATFPAAATEADVRTMLRQLVKERFGMESHTVTQERSGYALVVGRDGHKLQQAGPNGELPPMPDYFKKMPLDALAGRVVTSMEGPGTAAITGRGVPVSMLVSELSAALETLVIDQTGLAGNYYFGFRFLRDALDPAATSIPVFDAIQDELGLRLEATKGPAEILVVDRIAKVPTDN